MQRRWMIQVAGLLALAALACGCDMKKNLNAPLPTGGTVVVNEFLASNHAYGKDDCGAYADWIELYNRSSRAIDVAGYYVTDDLTKPTKWQVPTGHSAVTTIPSHGFLLIWCDNQACTEGLLHTTFGLSAGGEQIGLFDATGEPLDELTFGPQTADVSYGRNPDGGATWKLFTVPTPGASNTGGGAHTSPVIADVVLDPTVPTADNPVTVSAQITDDGSVSSATLHYAVGAGSFTAVAMTHVGSTWSGTVPGQAAGATVSYYLSAVDDEDNTTLDPAGAPTTTLHYTISTGVVPTLYINEFLADNLSGLTDANGDHDDWIEIYNPGDVAVDLGGMYVTDNLLLHDEWQIPTTDAAASTVPAHGYLILWADSQPEQGVTHVNFKLNASGEAIGLYTAAGETINEVTFGSQSTDVSQARVPDGSANWAFLTTPTPGATNGTGTRLRL